MKRTLIAVVVLCLPVFQHALAQGVADPLLMQGLDQLGIMSARSQAMGGSVIAVGRDADALFLNPAALNQLSSIEFHVGGYTTSARYNQTQQWVPNRFYADMSLMFENMIWGIKEPDGVINPVDKLHKPFDQIQPSWEQKVSHTRPAIASVAVPFTLGEIPVAAGIGYAEVVDLDHFFENNNAISPNIGEYRPTGIPLVATGDSLKVNWFQYIRQRDGVIRGITPAVSVTPFEGFSLGVSTTILTGSSDDAQERTERGLLTLFYNTYRLDRAAYHYRMDGTSKYKGFMTTIGMMYNQESYSLGLSIRPPVTITRDWNESVRLDSAGATRSYTQAGSDKMKLPVNYTLGLALYPSEKWTFGVDYDVRQFADARYTSSTGSTATPWASSKMFRVGAEYKVQKWLELRAGARQEIQVFTPAGEGLIGEPAGGSVYSGGVGFHFGSLTVDIAYEYANVEYQDLWQSNINFNQIQRSTGILEIGYKF